MFFLFLLLFLSFFLGLFLCQGADMSIGKGYIILLQSEAGAWACFDEFNRIQVEVLSVPRQLYQVEVYVIGKMVGAPWDGGPLIINPIYTLYSGYLLDISWSDIGSWCKFFIHGWNHLTSCTLCAVCGTFNKILVKVVDLKILWKGPDTLVRRLLTTFAPPLFFKDFRTSKGRQNLEGSCLNPSSFGKMNANKRLLMKISWFWR